MDKPQWYREFWVFETDLPPGRSTANFSAAHWSWLGVLLVIWIVLAVLYHDRSDRWRIRLRWVLSALLVIGEVTRLTWIISQGHFRLVDDLPLHLCNLAVFIELLANRRQARLLRNFSYACGMPGALAALLTPAWGAYPLFHFAYLEAIVAHGILVILPVLWIAGDGFRPDYKYLPACFGLIGTMALAAAAVNASLGSNYMFLHDALPGTILEIFARWCGTPGYILPLAGLLWLVWLILYLPWVLVAARRPRYH